MTRTYRAGTAGATLRDLQRRLLAAGEAQAAQVLDKHPDATFEPPKASDGICHYYYVYVVADGDDVRVEATDDKTIPALPA